MFALYEKHLPLNTPQTISQDKIVSKNQAQLPTNSGTMLKNWTPKFEWQVFYGPQKFIHASRVQRLPQKKHTHTHTHTHQPEIKATHIERLANHRKSPGVCFFQAKQKNTYT